MVEARAKVREKIINAFLLNVPRYGWTCASLERAVLKLGLNRNAGMLAFPGGIPEIIDYFTSWSDHRMLVTIEDMNFQALKIRDRIHACVKARLQINFIYREAIRRLISYFMLPTNATMALRLSWRTSSEIWYAAGDKSTDWNYYTKRGLLASVYSATLFYWLSDEPDESGDYPETWAFLERRISDVLLMFSLPKRLKSFTFGNG